MSEASADYENRMLEEVDYLPAVESWEEQAEAAQVYGTTWPFTPAEFIEMRRKRSAEDPANLKVPGSNSAPFSTSRASSNSFNAPKFPSSKAQKQNSGNNSGTGNNSGRNSAQNSGNTSGGGGARRSQYKNQARKDRNKAKREQRRADKKARQKPASQRGRDMSSAYAGDLSQYGRSRDRSSQQRQRSAQRGTSSQRNGSGQRDISRREDAAFIRHRGSYDRSGGNVELDRERDNDRGDEREDREVPPQKLSNREVKKKKKKAEKLVKYPDRLNAPGKIRKKSDSLLRCQERDGRLKESATGCSNELSEETCDELFGGNYHPRSVACNLRSMQVKAFKCAKTCRICCEKDRPIRGCRDNLAYDCLAARNKCWHPDHFQTMMFHCRKTCAMCGRQKRKRTGDCKDIAYGCRGFDDLCDVPKYAPYMTDKCTRTCDLCDGRGGHVCRDTATNCDPLQCSTVDAQLHSKMIKYCPFTCQLCELSDFMERKKEKVIMKGGDPKCFDLRRSCSQWDENYGFCDLPQYSDGKKIDYCAETCGFCRRKKHRGRKRHRHRRNDYYD
ncbi:hypothetical protein DdX_08529 [Ditylenchus destructor]|uniref:ShKT domain-containing protein n=1 Tax=Ditylenchus destructor TaxID=166010 RepID=A0AAD4N5K7_9BILA|nr:hypothetical protein DdX_08529 [Ditylenchus destructor]